MWDIEEEESIITKNLKVERGRPLLISVRLDGADETMRQINDSHWFFPNESPANIMVLPFIFNRNWAPLNLIHLWKTTNQNTKTTESLKNLILSNRKILK